MIFSHLKMRPSIKFPGPVLLLCGCLVLSSIFFGNACSHKEPPAPASRTVSFKVVLSPETVSSISALAEDFLASKPTLADGSKIKIEFVQERGLTAARRIAKGELKTQAWLSPSTALVNLANQTRVNLGPEQSDCTPLFYTPVVIASNTRNQELLQFAKDDQLSLLDILNSQSSATTSDKFDLSKIKFAQALPEAEDEGWAAYIQLAYLAKDQQAKLPASQYTDEELRRLASFHQRAFLYAESNQELFDALENSEQANIALTSEQQVLMHNSAANAAMPKLLSFPISEGSFHQTYSLCLSKADWLTAAQNAAIEKFKNFLLQSAAQTKLQQSGYRTYPIKNDAHSKAAFSAPSAEQMLKLLSSWQKVRRALATIMVFDTSGSMEGDALTLGKKNFNALITALGENDKAALISFDNRAKLESDFSDDKEMLSQKLLNLKSSGGSAAYDAIEMALRIASDYPTSYLKSIIVYTDGADKDSLTTLRSLLQLTQQVKKNNDLELAIVAIEQPTVQYKDLTEIAATAKGRIDLHGTQEVDASFERYKKKLE